MKRLIVSATLIAVLGGCGAAGRLKPADGKPLPVAPYGAAATPTPQALMTPSTQARPERNDELLTNSQKRDPDPFDLPPPN